LIKKFGGINMRVVIAGASGFIGRMLVPELALRGVELILLGRDPIKLHSLLPNYKVGTYDSLIELSEDADLFLNLATLNNDQPQDRDAMNLVNAHFAADLAKQAMSAGVKRFVNVSSIHALDPNDTRPYPTSKRAGVSAVDAATEGGATHVYLPAIIGDQYAGSLSPLNALPKSVAKVLLGPLSAVKPILSVTELADWVEQQAMTAERHVVLTNGQRNNLYYIAASRGLDIFASTLGLIVLSPLLLATWFLIRMQSDGPGIFAQKRVGRHGRIFTCYKFRTMAVGTVQAGTHEVSCTSVTALGSRLRKLKIDELPQLFNVFKGDMSLIGPRPCLPSQDELVKQRSIAGVLEVRPGISGLAQVNGIDMSIPEQLVAWDARYISLRGLIFDFKLILRTVQGGGRGDRVGK
jgi:lipopolysaccharide/colanic/teichoic acid biosynthesis glycosyltransferase